MPFNGEDNYANPGELMWEAENEGRFDDIVLGINVDDSGQRRHREPRLVLRLSARDRGRRARGDGAATSGFPRGPQWVQGDHAILGIHDVPAIAIASSEMRRFMELYAHTERDTLELADPGLVADVARFICQVLEALHRALAP